MAKKFEPSIIKQDDILIFELRDGVHISAEYASEKKLRFQLWRKDILLPPDEGNIFMASFRNRLVEQARDGFNEKNRPDRIPDIEADIGTVATLLGSKGDDGKSLHDHLVEHGGESITEKLITLGEDGAVLFRTPEKVAHAACRSGANGRVEVHEVNSREFKMWLRSEFKRTERERKEAAAKAAWERAMEAAGALPDKRSEAELHVERPPAVPPQALATAVSELEAAAVTAGAEEVVHLRVGGHEGRIYVDLVNEAWEAVEISAEGWRVLPSVEVPIRFVRSNVMQALPRPEEGGDVGELRRLLTLGEDEEEAWSLICSWLMGALRPDGRQYPVLILYGGHGTAKSTTLEMLRELVDPAVVLHEHTVSDAREVYIECVASWVFALDNLSRLPDWLSDTICRLATGGGFKTRTLFTNRDQEVFKAQRPVIVDGISEIATRTDLTSRALVVDMPVIPEGERKYLKELWAEFYRLRPAILGALFDALSAGVRGVDAVDLEERIPRLADFARWAVATEGALGFEAGTFEAAHKRSQESATETALEEAPVWHKLFELSQEHDESSAEPWVGTMTDLLKELNVLETDDALKRSKHWPKTAKGLSDIVRRLAPAFLEVGVHLEKHPGSRREGRRYRLFYRQPEDSEAAE